MMAESSLVSLQSDAAAAVAQLEKARIVESERCRRCHTWRDDVRTGRRSST
jgi:hypothetical protein